jgi:GNAT superfamily N-acetyltransferase
MIQITEMMKADLNRVAELSAQLGYPSTLEQVESRFRKMSQLSGYAMFVAKDESGKVLGWIQINEETAALVMDSKAEIGALVVDENYRSQKIGALLVARAEQWAQDQGLSLIRVRSNIIREKAHRFYLREGYSLKKTGHIFTKQIQVESKFTEPK